jgi:hypothetical protein
MVTGNDTRKEKKVKLVASIADISCIVNYNQFYLPVVHLLYGDRQ